MGRLNTVPMQRTMFDSILVVIWQMKSIKLLVFELRVILDMIFSCPFPEEILYIFIPKRIIFALQEHFVRPL